MTPVTITLDPFWVGWAAGVLSFAFLYFFILKD